MGYNKLSVCLRRQINYTMFYLLIYRHKVPYFHPLLLFVTALLAVHTGTHKLWLRSTQLRLFVCDVCRAWRCGCTPTSPVGVTWNKSVLCRLMNRTTSPPTHPPHTPATLLNPNPFILSPLSQRRSFHLQLCAATHNDIVGWKLLLSCRKTVFCH